MKKFRFANLTTPEEAENAQNSWHLSHAIVGNPSSTDLFFHIYAEVTGSSIVTGSTTPHASFLIPAQSSMPLAFGDKVNRFISVACSTSEDGTGLPTTGSTGVIYYGQ